MIVGKFFLEMEWKKRKKRGGVRLFMRGKGGYAESRSIHLLSISRSGHYTVTHSHTALIGDACILLTRPQLIVESEDPMCLSQGEIRASTSFFRSTYRSLFYSVLFTFNMTSALDLTCFKPFGLPSRLASDYISPD